MTHELPPSSRRTTASCAAAEIAGPRAGNRSGPLYRAVSTRGGFVSYETLEGVADVDALIAETSLLRGDPEIEEFEWKTRGHDWPPGPGCPAGGPRAGARGARDGDGRGGRPAADVDLPDGVTVRRVDADEETVVREACGWGARSSGAAPGRGTGRAAGPDAEVEEFWVAEAGGRVVCAGRIRRAGHRVRRALGRLHPVRVAGRGIYRALTAARARSALEHGVRYLHSDCTAMSRPILRALGLGGGDHDDAVRLARRGPGSAREAVRQDERVLYGFLHMVVPPLARRCGDPPSPASTACRRPGR